MRFIDFPEMDFVIQGLDMVAIPPMYKMKQIYDSNKIDDPAAYIKKMMADYQGIDKEALNDSPPERVFISLSLPL